MGGSSSKSQDEQAITQKIENIREQGERLSKGISSRIEQMTKDCTEALEKEKTATGDGQLSHISLRVDCMSEILGNLTLKLEDAFGNLSSSGASLSRVSIMEKSYTEVMERIKMLEDSSAKLEALSQKNENSLLQAKLDTAKVEALSLKNEQSLLQAKQDTAKVEALSLKNEQSLLQAKHDTEFQTIKLDKIQSKVIKLEDLHGEVLKVESRSTKHEIKHLQLETEIVKLQSGFQTSSNRSSDGPTDTEDIRKVWCEIEASSQRIQNLEEDIGNLRDELKESGRKVKDVEDTINIMHINNLEITEETKKLSKKMTAVRRTQAEFTDRMFEFERESELKSEMIEDKISHLQNLNSLLNKMKTSKDGQPKLKDMIAENKTELLWLNRDIDDIKTHLINVERPKVGFTARLHQNSTMTPGPNGVRLKKMTDVITNIRNCYHAFQSHFIAPHSGLYCFCVKIEFGSLKYNEEHFCVHIMSKFADTEACDHHEIPINSTHSTICTLQLETDQRVFLKVKGDTGKKVTILNTASFSGWAVEYH